MTPYSWVLKGSLSQNVKEPKKFKVKIFTRKPPGTTLDPQIPTKIGVLAEKNFPDP